MNIVQEAERRFLPSLKMAHEEISREFPQVNVSLSSFNVGELTGNPGHVFAVGCLLKTTSPDQTDNIGLEILLEHIDSEPTIYSSVTWGDPSGVTEDEVFADPTAASEAAFAELEARLPLLFETLKVALERGRPNNE